MFQKRNGNDNTANQMPPIPRMIGIIFHDVPRDVGMRAQKTPYPRFVGIFPHDIPRDTRIATYIVPIPRFIRMVHDDVLRHTRITTYIVPIPHGLSRLFRTMSHVILGFSLKYVQFHGISG